MTNFRIQVAYDGSRYNGWQRLGDTDNTIQCKIERVLGEMLGHKVEIFGAGRTDAGVHAHAQIAHFKINTEMTAEEVRAYLNHYLPEDIAVLDCAAVDERFHARLNAVGKRYVYRIWNSDTPNVFERKYLYRMEQPLDLDAMRKGAARLVGRHDFKAFCGNRKMKKSTIREIYRIDVERLGDEVRLTFVGSGFLYNMVRILTGTLVEIGEGKRSPAEIDALFDSRDRLLAGVTMPPQGLTLAQVYYERRPDWPAH